MNYIGKKIKELRKAQNITQETLANLLCVSYQSVSKWETCTTSPDLSLIVPLARLFHISTDELLGMSQYETNERRSHFDKLCEDARHHEADFDLLASARQAVAEFPDNMKYRDWLSDSLYYCAFETGDKMSEMLDECAEHALIVWKTDKTQLRYDALWRVVMAYAYSDRKELAKEYADLFPESETTYANRDRALTVCLEGKDLLMHKQKIFCKALADFTDACRSFSAFGDRRDPCTRQAVAVEKAVYEALFPNGNSLRYALPISNIHWKMAEFAMTDGDFEKAIQELSVSRQLRIEADYALSAVSEHYTSPLLDTIVYNAPGEIFAKSQLEYWLEELRKSKLFLPLKGRSDFNELIK